MKKSELKKLIRNILKEQEGVSFVSAKGCCKEMHILTNMQNQIQNNLDNITYIDIPSWASDLPFGFGLPFEVIEALNSQMAETEQELMQAMHQSQKQIQYYRSINCCKGSQ